MLTLTTFETYDCPMESLRDYRPAGSTYACRHLMRGPPPTSSGKGASGQRRTRVCSSASESAPSPSCVRDSGRGGWRSRVAPRVRKRRGPPMATSATDGTPTPSGHRQLATVDRQATTPSRFHVFYLWLSPPFSRLPLAALYLSHGNRTRPHRATGSESGVYYTREALLRPTK